MVCFISIADILLANDNLTKVLEEYRNVVGVPGEPPNPNVPSSSQSVPPDIVQSNNSSSNLSTLIDLDIGGATGDSAQTTKNTNGDEAKLSNDLHALSELKCESIPYFPDSKALFTLAMQT